jgi:hypothetical protein
MGCRNGEVSSSFTMFYWKSPKNSIS